MIQKSSFFSSFETYEDCLNCHSSDWLFFDIETTGFSPGSSFLYLIGVLRKTSEGWKLTQWLGESPQEETAILKEFLDTACHYSCLVHFNGTTFDLPYLKEKAEKAGLSHTLDDMKSLDLYRIFRPLKKLLCLERMNQTSLESFLGIKRRDKMNGKTLIPVCRDFMASGDPRLESLLLLHNREDVEGMTALLSLSAYLKFTDPERDRSFLKLSAAVRKGETPELSFSYSPALPQSLSVNLQQYGSLELGFRKGVLRAPVFSGELRYFFPDYKNYYYLTLEDQAVHKSIAAYVDKEYRRPATAATCYTRKKGEFLLQPDVLFAPDYRKEYGSKEHYFELTEKRFQTAGSLQLYLVRVLKAALPQ